MCVGAGCISTEPKERKWGAEGSSALLGEASHPAHLSAQLGPVFPSQRRPWKPVAQRQRKVSGLLTQVPPLRHEAGERSL